MIYHPDLTACSDLPAAITPMAEDSTKISSIVALHVVLALVLLFGQDRSQVLISILAVTVVMLITWLHASQRSLPSCA